MDDSSDRAQLLYKLIKPSLHPSLKVKGAARMTAQSSSKHAATHSLTATSFTIRPWWAVPIWRGEGGRRTAAKCNRMTQPRSLVRLLIMISLILLICSASYQAVQAGAPVTVCASFLCEKRQKLHAFQMRMWDYKCTVSYVILVQGGNSASSVFNGTIRVCFLALMCLLSQSGAQPRTQPLFLHWFFQVQHADPLGFSEDYKEKSQLFGELTHSCSLISGLVMNFISVIGLNYNILSLKRLVLLQSIMKLRQKHHFSCIMLNYSRQPWSKETDSVTDKY